MTHTDTAVGSNGHMHKNTHRKKLTVGETGKTYNQDKEASDKGSQRHSVELRGQCGDELHYRVTAGEESRHKMVFKQHTYTRNYYESLNY